MTLRTIREIANCTKDATAAIVGLGPAQSERQFGVGQMLVLELSNAGDDEEMEDVGDFSFSLLSYCILF